MSSKVIMDQWQKRKVSSEQAKEDLARSRCCRAVANIMLIEALDQREQEIALRERVGAVLDKLENSLGRFRSHPRLDAWLAERAHQAATVHFRSRSLLLRGKSRSGKSQKALSLFGYTRTLLVNCQGLDTALPSLRPFQHGHHDAIVFDEISERQVLANKMVFQCGPWPVQLSQSVCNQHAYERWFYGCAMILCSNTFRMTVEEGLDEEEEDWLRANIVDACLPAGEVWYVPKAKPHP